MTVQRILMVSGTHGNEINPVWAVKQFNRKENALNHGIEYEYIIGNPAAYEKGCWFFDLAKSGGPRVNYQAVGSGSGRKAFIDQTVNFGASDDPMKAKDIAKVKIGRAHV